MKWNCRISLLFLCIALLGCNKKDDVVPIQLPVPAVRVLVYMVADNSLSNQAMVDINEMEQGLYDAQHASNKSTMDLSQDILVYVDQALNGTYTKPCLMRLRPDNTSRVVSEVVKTYDEQNSADPEVLRLVLNDAKNAGNQFNDLKGLVLWSHGSGWVPPATPLTPMLGNALRSFGYDNSAVRGASKEMDIRDLAQVLQGNHFDFILFDACLMGGVEIAYELKDVTKQIVSCPTSTLAAGAPYDRIVPLFLSKEPNYVIDIAKQYFDYYDKQLGTARSSSISVVNTYELPALAKFMKDQVSVLFPGVSINDAQAIYYKSQLQQLDEGGSAYFFDLKQFVDLLYQQNQKSSASFDAIWSQLIPYEAHTDRFVGDGVLYLNHCNGLSMYFPQGYAPRLGVEDYYKGFAWYHDANLQSLFKEYLP